MRKTSAGLISLALAAGMGTTFGSPAASVTPSAAPRVGPEAERAGTHEKRNPLETKRRALREEALTTLLAGDGKVLERGPSTVMKVGRTETAPAVDREARTTAAATSEAEYVELGRETTDRVFVILAEFGNKRHRKFPDKDLEPDIAGPTTFDGPLHNAIPEPDRSRDNRTIWQPDYDRAHYEDLYFGEGDAPGSAGDVESVRQYYERQSSGRYSIDGTVHDWVKVKYNEARYGRSSDDPSNGDDPAVCADIVCDNTWNLVGDAVKQWVKAQRKAGLTNKEIRAELATFDQWDRYDFDFDGDFNEPDGYIDHFQVVHAGGDQADGDPHQGEDAIWSHRWYAYYPDIGRTGPRDNPGGGVEIGNTGMWVGDYTIQPENGGMSVFAHEYGHDLGLPDLYDTSGGENSVEWWSMMSQSRVSAPQDQGIGTRAADLGAWEKLQLGWLDYEAVRSDQRRRLTLGPHEYNSKDAQAAIVVLPPRQRDLPLIEPFAGERSWWSGSGNDLDNTMTREVTLPDGEATLSMQAAWNIEDCGPDTPCDYAYVEVDAGDGWAAIPGSITQPGEGNGIDGSSPGWVPATFDLSAYAGSTIGLRLRYLTDPAVAGRGFFADDIEVTAGDATVLESGAESSPEGWTLDGFVASGATYTEDYDNYYIASHRDYVSFDSYLESGPYNFGFAERPDWAEFFPYQDGLLISYWDTFHDDNNTSEHPGEGMVLPVDANPRPLVRLDGKFWRPRVAAYDAPFSTEKSDSLTLHVDGQENYIRGQDAQPVFRDKRKYWFPRTPTAGVDVPDNGVNIKVLRQQGSTMDIRIFNRG